MVVGTAALIIGVLLIGGFIVYLVFDPIDGVGCKPGYHMTSDLNCCPDGYNSDGTQCVEGIEDSGTLFSPFGEVRNCIKQVMRPGPSCSDTSEKLLQTTCNGRTIGDMSYSDAWQMCR